AVRPRAGSWNACGQFGAPNNTVHLFTLDSASDLYWDWEDTGLSTGAGRAGVSWIPHNPQEPVLGGYIQIQGVESTKYARQDARSSTGWLERELCSGNIQGKFVTGLGYYSEMDTNGELFLSVALNDLEFSDNG